MRFSYQFFVNKALLWSPFPEYSLRSWTEGGRNLAGRWENPLSFRVVGDYSRGSFPCCFSHRCCDSPPTSQLTLQACASASMHAGTGCWLVLSLKTLKISKTTGGRQGVIPVSLLSKHEIRHTRQSILSVLLKGPTGGRGPGSRLACP